MQIEYKNKILELKKEKDNKYYSIYTPQEIINNNSFLVFENASIKINKSKVKTIYYLNIYYQLLKLINNGIINKLDNEENKKILGFWLKKYESLPKSSSQPVKYNVKSAKNNVNNFQIFFQTGKNNYFVEIEDNISGFISDNKLVLVLKIDQNFANYLRGKLSGVINYIRDKIGNTNTNTKKYSNNYFNFENITIKDIGLSNLSNFCYANSIIQMLYHLKKLNGKIVNENMSDIPKLVKAVFIAISNNLLRTVINQRDSIIKIIFKDSNQHDASEFLERILDSFPQQIKNLYQFTYGNDPTKSNIYPIVPWENIKEEININDYLSDIKDPSDYLFINLQRILQIGNKEIIPHKKVGFDKKISVQNKKYILKGVIMHLNQGNEQKMRNNEIIFGNNVKNQYFRNNVPYVSNNGHYIYIDCDNNGNYTKEFNDNEVKVENLPDEEDIFKNWQILVYRKL